MQKTEEEWRDIVGYEGRYQVSNMGRVRNARNGYVLKPNLINSGYLVVSLGSRGRKLIHRIVGEAFLDNPDGLPCMNHRDYDKLNNNADNLEYCSYSYNNSYGRHKELQSESHIKRLEHNKRCRKVICLESGKVFFSVRDVERQLGINHSGISRACRLEGTCGGYHWRYADGA